MKQNFDEDSCAGCSDVDCGDRSPRRSQPCPSPVASDDCFDPCAKSTRRRGRSPRDQRRGSSTSPAGGRKPIRSASDVCDDSPSINAGRRSASGRRRDPCCDDTPRRPTRDLCSELALDRNKAPFRRSMDNKGYDSPMRSTSPSRPAADLEPSELGRHRSGHTTPASRSPSGQRGGSWRDDCDDDGQHDGSLERTTASRTRGAGRCCPNLDERDCESTESRFLQLIPLTCLCVIGIVITSTKYRGARYCYQCVCVCVCLSVHVSARISYKPHDQT